MIFLVHAGQYPLMKPGSSGFALKIFKAAEAVSKVK
jgi:hypothetical protein